MMRVLLIPLAAAQAVAPPPLTGPPILTQPVPPPEPAITRFRAGPARCGGEEQRAVLVEEPFPAGVMRPPPRAAAVTLRFRIDAGGRPHAIAVSLNTMPGFTVADVPAALAAWRFAPGPERRDCRIAFSAATETVADAAPETLYRFLALHPISGYLRANAVGRAAFERARPPGSTCFDPLPNPRLLAFPPFERIAVPPGTVAYSWLSYDIAAGGRVRNARLLGGSGHRDLDRESLAAVSRSRFQPGARTGCVHHFWRRHDDPMPAPPIPDEEAFRPAGATCPEDEPDWASMPPLRFPGEFNRRAIEGWAVLSYDLSPWGQPGNVQVRAAEPAAVFGEEAARIVSAARTPPAGSGYVGCTTRVIFRVPSGGPEADDV